MFPLSNFPSTDPTHTHTPCSLTINPHLPVLYSKLNSLSLTAKFRHSDLFTYHNSPPLNKVLLTMKQCHWILFSLTLSKMKFYLSSQTQIKYELSITIANSFLLLTLNTDFAKSQVSKSFVFLVFCLFVCFHVFPPTESQLLYWVAISNFLF